MLDEEGRIQGDKPAKADQFINELEFYAEALKEQRKKGLPF
jgi:hypothetical protein